MKNESKIRPNFKVPTINLTTEDLNNFSNFMEKWQTVFAVKVSKML